MTPKQRVINKFPKAVCLVTHEQNYWVISDPNDKHAKLLGEGDSFSGYRGAWANAAALRPSYKCWGGTKPTN